MKILMIVRHGEYGNDDRLNEIGRRQIADLAEKLGGYTNGGSVLLLTSPADRAHESAEIIGFHFGVELEDHEVLWSDNRHSEDFPSALELIKSRQGDADILILVTHLEYVESLPAYFASEELGVELNCREIKKGEAWVVDCSQKSLTHVV